MLADQLEISPAQVEVERPSEVLGWYLIRSAVTYPQESVAAAAAQKLWEASAVLKRFRERKVICARYGYEEVETGYPIWLGECHTPEKPWPKSTSRAEHMAERAMRETLMHALDVNGWRAFIEMPFKYATDDQLLQKMHELRAKSRHQSDEARAESAQWLAAHGIAERTGRPA